MLEDSPSLRREVSSLIEKETKRTIDVVTAELRDRGELRDAPGGPTNPSNRRLGSYTEDQILGDWFPADPAREAE
jgi:hypothetical protein